MLKIIGVTFLFKLLPISDAELYSSVVQLETLLETEKRTIDVLDLFIHKEEKRLAVLNRYLDLFKREHAKALEDIPNYIGNPISCYTLIRRMTIDLEHIQSSIQKEKEYSKEVTVKQMDVLYPDAKDLSGAAQGIARLQNIYNLDAEDLAKGILYGANYSTSMTASDCYVLGQTLYKRRDYKNARVWMVEAFRKYYMENITQTFSDYDILNYFRKTCFKLDDSIHTIEWTQKLLDMVPSHPQVKKLLAYYQQVQHQEFVKIPYVDPITKRYEALCRGELDVPIKISSKLTCRYLTENHPFLLIAPFKIEMKYLDPDIVLFHNVLSDDEMKTFKTLAAQDLERAKVIDHNTGEPTSAEYRISKSHFFDDSEEIAARISRRVQHMTGLSLETAEQFVVLNYGIGGHYVPHNDFFRASDSTYAQNDKMGIGNRIATVLFYLSDVTQGGATVFTKLGVSVSPVKGTAVFFYNLRLSGKQDYDLLHGACPVIHGYKWVATKWLHEGGQELQCSVTREKNEFIRQIDVPVSKI